MLIQIHCSIFVMSSFVFFFLYHDKCKINWSKGIEYGSTSKQFTWDEDENCICLTWIFFCAWLTVTVYRNRNRISKQRKTSSSSSSFDFFCVFYIKCQMIQNNRERREDKITSNIWKLRKKIDSAHCNNEPRTKITRYFFFFFFFSDSFIHCVTSMTWSKSTAMRDSQICRI